MRRFVVDDRTHIREIFNASIMHPTKEEREMYEKSMRSPSEARLYTFVPAKGIPSSASKLKRHKWLWEKGARRKSREYK